MVLNEVYCTECQKYFRFRISEEESGDLDIPCKNCGHMHYRVVEKGVITGDRWAMDVDGVKMTREELEQVQQNTVGYTYTGSYTVSMYSSSTASSTYLTDAWADATSSSDAATGDYYHPGAP